MAELASQLAGYSQTTMRSVAALEADEDTIPLELIVALLERIDATDRTGGAVLVFLPGWSDISKLFDLLKAHRRVCASCLGGGGFVRARACVCVRVCVCFIWQRTWLHIDSGCTVGR